jgi:hypothetical protein
MFFFFFEGKWQVLRSFILRGSNKIYKSWSKWKGTSADRAKPTTKGLPDRSTTRRAAYIFHWKGFLSSRMFRTMYVVPCIIDAHQFCSLKNEKMFSNSPGLLPLAGC